MFRLRVACALVVIGGGFSAAANDHTDPVPSAQLSRLDYLVLASMADASRPFALIAYRPAPQK
jgi:hypothetical protein